MTIFGDFVRNSRKELGMTLEDLSSKVGISASMLSRLENGKRGIPSDKIFFRLAEALGVDWKELSLVAQESTENEEKRRLEPSPYFTNNFLEFVDDAAGVARIPLLRDVSANGPILSSQNIIGTKLYPVEEIGDEYFYLEVSDDSMTDAGITNGDHVLVQVKDTPEIGKICLVSIDNQPKAFLRKVTLAAAQKMFVLQAANIDVSPILIPRFGFEQYMRVIGMAVRVEKPL